MRRRRARAARRTVAWMLFAPALAAVAPNAARGEGALMAASASVAASVGVAPSPVSAPAGAPLVAASDSTLDRFFGGMSDSTDRYFGRATAPVDTAGLDSARDQGLALGPRHAPRSKLRLDWGPALRFNRVDSGVYGAALALGRRSGFGRLRSHLVYASGPRIGLGGAEWERRWGGEERRWVLGARGGHETAVMDRVRPETVDDPLHTIDALAFGSDTRQFVRRVGFGLSAERLTPTWRIGAGWRDEIESMLDVTTSWNLMDNALRSPDNVHATHGRAREGLLALWARAPRLPLYGEIDYRVSRRSLGSDFEYRLTRLAVAADLGVGRWSAIAPQIMVGRLIGDAPPQEAFYLDRAGVLTTRIGERLAGSRIALARLDWIGTRDLLALARLPHPAMFPLQGDAFVGAGAVWGADPYGGPSRPGGNWPGSGLWSSEAGFALAWQPGFPDPTHLARIAVAWPLDGRPVSTRFTLTFSRALFLVQPPDR